MNRYLLFAGDSYYPQGGAFDFIKSFKTKAAALRYILGKTKQDQWNHDWWHILDTETGQYGEIV